MHMPNIEKHSKSGVYRYQKRVPPDIRAIIGKTWIVESLGTKDPREADRLSIAVADRVEKMFAAARRGEWPLVTDEEIEDLIGIWWGWLGRLHPAYAPDDESQQPPLANDHAVAASVSRFLVEFRPETDFKWIWHPISEHVMLWPTFPSLGPNGENFNRIFASFSPGGENLKRLVVAAAQFVDRRRHSPPRETNPDVLALIPNRVPTPPTLVPSKPVPARVDESVFDGLMPEARLPFGDHLGEYLKRNNIQPSNENTYRKTF